MKKYLLLLMLMSAAAVIYAADTVSYRLSRLDNWAFYGTSKPIVELVAINDRGINRELDLGCSIFDNNGKKLYELSQKGIVPQKDSLKMSFSFMAMDPGFYNAIFTSGGRFVKAVNLSYEPEKIVLRNDVQGEIPVVVRDFDPKFSIVKNKGMSGREKNVYELKMVSADGCTVGAYVAFPKGKRNLKSIVSIVPQEKRSENVMSDFTAPANMIELILYVSDRGTGDEQFVNALADVLLCIDFLSGRKESDTGCIYVQGTGKAASVALMASAMDKRVAASFVYAPDFGNLIENFPVASVVEKMTSPVLFGLGLQDTPQRLTEDFAIYNAIGGKKEYFIFPDSPTVDRNKWKYIRDTFIIRLR